MLTAHSGSDHYQDNSKEFILAALNSHVDCFEIDCLLHPSGKLYLSHDEVENVDDLLTLEDAFQLMKEHNNQSIIINVDCKHFEVGNLALSLAEEMNLLNRVILSGSLNLNEFEATKKVHLFYNLENSIKMEELGSPEVIKEKLKMIADKGVKVVQTHFSVADEAFVELLASYHLKLSVWTVNSLEEIDQYLEMGCINVTSRIAFQYLSLLESRKNHVN